MLAVLVCAISLSAPAAAQEEGCQLATLFGHLAGIQTACCNGNICASGYPGTEDACDRDCGEMFEPFWDSCGEMLAQMNVGGTEGMTSFCKRWYSLVCAQPSVVKVMRC